MSQNSSQPWTRLDADVLQSDLEALEALVKTHEDLAQNSASVGEMVGHIGRLQEPLAALTQRCQDGLERMRSREIVLPDGVVVPMPTHVGGAAPGSGSAWGATGPSTTQSGSAPTTKATRVSSGM
jgi:hypothetical protein